MPDIEQEPSLHQAAAELQRYLSGDIAPMMVVEYFEELAPQPAEVTAKIIVQWMQSQVGGTAGSVATADLIYHALKKLSLLSELELVRRATMIGAIHEISRMLLRVCPEAQRDDLRMRLSHLGETTTVLTSRAELLHHEGGLGGGAGAGAGKTDAKPVAPKPDPEAMDRGARALSLLLDGLSKPAAPKPDAEAMDRGVRALSLLLDGLSKLQDLKTPPRREGPEAAHLAQVLSTAALESRTNEDLTRHLERVKTDGAATPMSQVFRTLGWSLPGWGSVSADGKAVDASAGRQLKAMDKIVALAPDAQERAKRWGEMIYAAIEQLNEGRLAQTVSILEVAKRLMSERKPDAEIVAQVLSQAEGAISDEILRRIADNPTKHGLLRKVLEFFPSLRPDMLLFNLDGEPRREKRKLMLTLLECHGPSIRDTVLTKLASVMGGEMPDPHGYYRRNLAFLLRRIPRVGNERLEEEMELLTLMIDPSEAPIVAREAVGALAQLRHRPAELALVDRLRRLESELISRGGDKDSLELADRLCAGLARHGTVRAIRGIASHAYNRHPALGDSLARLEHLSRVDLAVDPEQLAVFLKSMRELAASKVLGFIAQRAQHELSCVMQGVAGTPTIEVRAALEAIATQFKRNALGEQARRTLASLEPSAKKTTEALTGDLELFGLPNLLQSLAGAESSGELVLFDARQARQGSIAMVRGQITRCEGGRLSGEEAVYLFMEKPFPGTFAFRSAADGGGTMPKETLDPMSLILEGARRHDEYQQAKAFAADGVRFEPAGIPAVRPEDETDGKLAAKVWERAASGTTANDCELEMQTDPFRVRRLYAHWVETRALRPRVE